MPWGLLCPNVLWKIQFRSGKQSLEVRMGPGDLWGTALLTH